MIHIGARLNGAPSPEYQTALHYAELAPESPLPNRSTLTKWRKQMEATLEAGLVVPRSCLVSAKGALRIDEELETNLGWLREAVEALEPRVLIVPTPKEITPGKRDTELLTQFLQLLPPAASGTLRVWVPGGLWELEDATVYAEKHGLICSLPSTDPVVADGAVAYVRLYALANRPSLSDSQIERILTQLESADTEEVFIAVQTRTATKDALRIAQSFSSDLTEPDVETRV